MHNWFQLRVEDVEEKFKQTVTRDSTQILGILKYKQPTNGLVIKLTRKNLINRSNRITCLSVEAPYIFLFFINSLSNYGGLEMC